MKTQVWMQIVWVPILSQVTFAQVVPDRTLPVGEQSQVSGDLNTQINGGATRGNNLFHSFQQFSIPIGGSASFNNPANITNILTRVTGSNISNIDGLIRADGTANLFLINPNGILFGANARLEIGGSFLASTAASLKFANGFEFSASNPQALPLLTISAPIGLQYGNGIGEIRSQGAILQVPNGQTLNLTGGNVAIEGGRLLAPGGRVELAGVAAAGEVGLRQQGQEWRLSVPDGLARADVSIGNDAIIDIRSDGGGSIAITARNFTGTGFGTQVLSGIAAGLGTVDAQAGDIDINATEAIYLNEMGIFNLVTAGGTGNSGNITITTGTLSLTKGMAVSARTAGQGNAGNVTITAKNGVSVDGVDSDGAGSVVGSGVAPGSIGQGGNVSITTNTLSLTNGGRVATSTLGQGNAGNITITARDAASFEGVDSDGVGSGAFSRVSSGGIGQGGTIAVNTDRFSIINGSQLSASSEGQGAAGNLEVATRQLHLDNQGSIQAQTSSGRGGDIILQVPDLLLLRRGSFISTTAGTAQAGGNGGNITIDAKLIVAVPQEDSNLSANAFSGSGGNVRITTQGIFGIEPRAQETPLSDITASSDFGLSGTVTLNTPDVDPSRGTPLPTGLVDTDALISSSCIARNRRQDRGQGRFIITGTGGLAMQPDDLANSAFPTYELVPDVTTAANSPSPTLIVEADRAVRLPSGTIVLGRLCQ